MALVGRIGESLAELLIASRSADVLGRAAAGCFEEHGLRKADDGKGTLDLDAVRPAVAEVVKVLERFRADIFDCRQQRDLARIERAISPVLISQTPCADSPNRRPKADHPLHLERK